jgi:hypothetical protein
VVAVICGIAIRVEPRGGLVEGGVDIAVAACMQYDPVSSFVVDAFDDIWVLLMIHKAWVDEVLEAYLSLHLQAKLSGLKSRMLQCISRDGESLMGYIPDHTPHPYGI